jgi:hypothetical protein
LLETVFEVLNSFIEGINALDRLRPFKLQPWLVDEPRGTSKRGHYGYFRLTHLECEEEQNEDNEQ